MKRNWRNPESLVMIGLIVFFVATVIMYPSLPNDLPMQFARDGSVNWTLPKYLGVLIIPCFVIVFYCYFKKKNTLTYRSVQSFYLMFILYLGTLFYIGFLR